MRDDEDYIDALCFSPTAVSGVPPEHRLVVCEHREDNGDGCVFMRLRMARIEQCALASEADQEEAKWTGEPPGTTFLKVDRRYFHSILYLQVSICREPLCFGFCTCEYDNPDPAVSQGYGRVEDAVMSDIELFIYKLRTGTSWTRAEVYDEYEKLFHSREHS